jgi:hypothetical protein
MISIRNKRLKREIERDVGFVVEFPEEEWEESTVLQMNVPEHNLSLLIAKEYPFRIPKVMYKGTESTKYLSNLQQKVKPFADCHDYPLQCQCCTPFRKDWCPTFGVKDVVRDFLKNLTLLENIERLADLSARFPFDNNVLKEILKFF